MYRIRCQLTNTNTTMTETSPIQGPNRIGTSPKLNAAQLQAINSDHPRILTIAGPGSGKTRVLIERINRLCSTGTDPARIVAITYTNSAADEMRSRLEHSSDIGFVGTLHSFMLRLVQQNANALGYSSPRLAVLSETQADELLERCATEVHYTGTKKDLAAAVASRVVAYTPAVLAACRFQNALRRNSLVTFDTLLADGLRLCRTENAIGFLDYDHLLVDEYQDACDLHAGIYRSLRIPNFFAVGDPDQSIFGFLGSNVSNIVELANDPEFEVIHLEANYRCGQAICDAANNLIGHNQGRVEKATVSATGSTGDVDVSAFMNEQAERRAITAKLLGSYSDLSCAVLLRSNILVDEWVNALEYAGIPIARRIDSTMPEDWAFVRQAVALMVDPSNQWLAQQYLSSQFGHEHAEKLRLAATAAGKPLEVAEIPAGLQISRYGLTLAQIGASPESIELVETAVDTLPPDSTGSDLLLAISQTDESQEVGDGVWVGTYHGAKGREFDAVFLPCCEQEIIPGTGKNRSLEEERRLFYVGLTRARHQVTISYARERKPAYGRPKPVPATPSQFISEIQS